MLPRIGRQGRYKSPEGIQRKPHDRAAGQPGWFLPRKTYGSLRAQSCCSAGTAQSTRTGSIAAAGGRPGEPLWCVEKRRWPLSRTRSTEVAVRTTQKNSERSAMRMKLPIGRLSASGKRWLGAAFGNGSRKADLCRTSIVSNDGFRENWELPKAAVIYRSAGAIRPAATCA